MRPPKPFILPTRLSVALSLLLLACGGPTIKGEPRPEGMEPPHQGALVKKRADDGQLPKHPDQGPALGAHTRRQGAMVLDGIPKIPGRIKERMNQYLNSRGAFFADWEETGDGMFILTRFGDTNQVHRVAAPSASRQQLTFFPEPVKEARAVVSARDKALMLFMDRGGAENYQLYRSELATGKTRLITDGKSRVSDFCWSRRGKLAFNSNARNGKDMDIYLLDSAGSAARRVMEVSGLMVPVDFSPDEMQLLLMEMISINETYLHLLDLSTGKARALTPRSEGKVARLAARWAGHGKGIYYTSDEGGEFVGLFYMDLKTQKSTSLTRKIPWNVEELALSPDDRTLALSVNEEGYGRLYTMDTRTRRLKKIPLPDGLIWGLRFAPRGPQRLGFTLMQPTAPAEAYSYHLGKRKITRWTLSEVGGLDRGAFARPTLIRFPTFDPAWTNTTPPGKVSGPTVEAGPRTIPAFYYKPAGKGPHPVVISIHGGPESQYRPYFDPQLQFWVRELGLAVLAPNVRGSDGYGKSYLLLDNGKKREDSVKDIGALLDWIARQPELDPARVMVYGGSYGGYMVLASLVHHGARLRGGVDWVGISNFVTFLNNTKSYRRDLRRAEYGDERDPAMRAFLTAISPLTRAREILSPLLVIQGANDPRVPASESAQLVEAVRKNGQDAWYLLAENEGHGFRKKTNRDMARLVTIHFIERLLLRPDAKASPVK